MNAPGQLPNLDKIFRDEDEPDFVPSGGSNLAAIFGLQSKHTDSQSTKQTAPKKSNTQYNIQQAAPASKTEVLIAKAVHVYKLQNGTYDSIGKLGMALTGNATTRMYQIILYRNKQDYISVATVTRDFVYTVQTSNYASYYDNSKDNWSILFKNSESYLEFAIEVGLARYFAMQDRGENVIYQDLTPSDKDATAKEGDNISIKYFVSTEIVQPFKINFVMSQTMTVEISTDENWERVLLGSGKGLMRILFLPPSKQISLGPGFPKERDITMIIEITDIRTPEKHPPASKPSVSGKAAIISRMAKMGQSILPKMPLPSTTDSEDTEEDVPQKSLRHKRAEQSETGTQKNLQASSEEKRATRQKNLETRSEVPSVDSLYRPLVAASPLTPPPWTPPYFAGLNVAMDNQISYPISQAVNRAVPAALDPGVNMLLSETRIANAEIRMGMSKISDNVQKLLDKFHALELERAAMPATGDKATVDASWKMLLALNACQAGASNGMPKSADRDTSDEKIQEARNRISTLESDLKETNEEKESLLRVNKDLDSKLQELEIKLTSVNDELRKAKENLETAESTIKRCKEEKIILQSRLSKSESLSKEHNNTSQTDTASSKQKDIERKNKEIKQIMNKTYHMLSTRLASESRSELPFDYVKSTIASTIKHITLQVLYEDPEEEVEQSEASKSVQTAGQLIEEQANEGRILNSPSDEDFSTRRVETAAKSAMIMPRFENEPPPVPPDDGIDEVDSDLD